MRKFQFGIAATSVALVCALSTGSQAAGSCVGIAALGDGLTKDLAVLMSTHGLQNIIISRGLKPQGQITTTCTDGSVLTECKSSQKACK